MVDQVALLVVVSPAHQEQGLKAIRSVLTEITRAETVDEALELLKSQKAAILVAPPENLSDLLDTACQHQDFQPPVKIPVIIVECDLDGWKIIQEHPVFFIADCLSLPIDSGQLLCRVQMLMELQVCSREFDQKELELEVIQTELDEKTVELKALSSVDEVTGLFNQHYFDENMSREWLRAARLGQEVGLLNIEVGGFAAWCETVETSVSDLILRGFGLVLHESLLRPMDMVARREGGMFAILLPDTDRRGAVAVVKRILQAAGDYLDDEQLDGANLKPVLTGAVMKACSDSPAVLLRLAAKARKELNSTSADSFSILSGEMSATSP